LQVNISEMDVRVRDVAGDAATKLARQRQVYHDVVAACVAVPRCEAVTLWGFTDAHSWIDSTFGADDPLLFDERYRAKPAFYGVADAFLRR
jgi:GH35 family endo-1,4-beta-xylanase